MMTSSTFELKMSEDFLPVDANDMICRELDDSILDHDRNIRSNATAPVNPFYSTLHF